jgi:hypothetical protein
MEAMCGAELLNAYEKEDHEKLESVYNDFTNHLSEYSYSDILQHYNAGLVCRDKNLERFIPGNLVFSTTKKIAVVK